MLPAKEIQDLALALTKMADYEEMMKHRRVLYGNTNLSRQMQFFEKEQERIANSNAAQEEISTRIKRLLDTNKDFLEKAEVKNYVSANRQYQKMMSDCFAALYKAMDSHIYRR